MNVSSKVSPEQRRYELRFQALSSAGQARTFPCDAAGRVDMDALSDTEREDYLYARIVVGYELCMPAVIVRSAH